MSSPAQNKQSINRGSDCISEPDDARQRDEQRTALSSAEQSRLLPTALWPGTAVDHVGHLNIGGCNVVELGRRYGTPLYLFDERTLRDVCRSYRSTLSNHYPAASAVHYAAKALLNTALVQLIGSEGLGVDVASGGELYIATHAGAAPSCIRLHGNAKTRDEIEEAVRLGVGQIIVDNLDEIQHLGSVTRAFVAPVEISLRIAPEIEAATHRHIQTGHRESKFGFALGSIEQVLHAVAQLPSLRIKGLHFHLGSQILSTDCFERAITVAARVAVRLREQGVEIEEFSPGGGLGVAYTEFDPVAAVDYFVEKIARFVTEAWRKQGLRLPRLVLEPGRSICARAGVALYSIVATKPLPAGSRVQRYLHLDGGMADNIRPALYGARYSAVVANRLSEAPDERVCLSGRYCESSDVLVRDIQLPSAARPGDLIAIPMAGAYTLSMASNYNGARRPEVVLVADGKARTIQRRESFADLVSRDFPLAAVEGSQS